MKKVHMVREDDWVPVEVSVNGDALTNIWKWGRETLTDVDSWDISFRTSIQRGLKVYMDSRHKNIPITFYFSNEEDATLFKLRWV